MLYLHVAKYLKLPLLAKVMILDEMSYKKNLQKNFFFAYLNYKTYIPFFNIHALKITCLTHT